MLQGIHFAKGGESGSLAYSEEGRVSSPYRELGINAHDRAAIKHHSGSLAVQGRRCRR